MDRETRATIAKLNVLVMNKYESYRTRRVPITIPAGASTVAAATTRADSSGGVDFAQVASGSNGVSTRATEAPFMAAW